MCNKDSSKISQGDVSQQFLEVWAVFVPSEPWVSPVSLQPWCAWPSGGQQGQPRGCSMSLTYRCCQGSGTQAWCRMGSLWDPLASSSSARRRLQDCPGCWEGEWYPTPQVIGVGVLPVLHCLAGPLSGFPLLRNHHHLGVMERCCSTRSHLPVCDLWVAGNCPALALLASPEVILQLSCGGENLQVTSGPGLATF